MLRRLLTCLGVVSLALAATPHLRDRSRLPIGVAYCNGKRNAKTSPIIDREFSRLTSTEFYPFLLTTEAGKYRFEGADQAVLEAIQSHRPLHGHCLLYHLEEVCPPYWIRFSGNNRDFELMVGNYLKTVVGRYRGRVQAYDLCNELFDEHGDCAASWLRRRFSSDREFFDFIGRCYGYAHQADPQALLFYADYGQEVSTNGYAKGWAIAHQLMRWRRQGVPVHGYALQVHTNIYRPRQDLEESLKRAVGTGLKVAISELDVSINVANPDAPGRGSGVQGLSATTPELLQRQAETYRSIARMYRRQVPPAQQHGITLWDIGDADSWLNRYRFEAATVFDRDYRPKPAFYGLCEGLSD